MTEESVKELILRFKRGEEKAFNELVNLYKKGIFNLVLRMVRNREDAMDLTQEVFVKAYRSLDDFRGDSSFSTWLHRIAVNLSLNFTQRDKFRSFISLPDIASPITSSDSPSIDFERKELDKTLDQAVSSLPGKQRSVFVLRYYEELPYSEIASILEKNEGTIKANYFQAVRKLRKFLAHLLE
ncbi:MAG: sigma-70 family RNA polymerase sigma factor [candidate division Zixibacteria bacterium]|nr:sigma-70 family RNA polymerase sigma factor [candidate division Zixibacteria bacterium]